VSVGLYKTIHCIGLSVDTSNSSIIAIVLFVIELKVDAIRIDNTGIIVVDTVTDVAQLSADLGIPVISFKSFHHSDFTVQQIALQVAEAFFVILYLNQIPLFSSQYQISEYVYVASL